MTTTKSEMVISQGKKQLRLQSSSVSEFVTLTVGDDDSSHSMRVPHQALLDAVEGLVTRQDDDDEEDGGEERDIDDEDDDDEPVPLRPVALVREAK